MPSYPSIPLQGEMFWPILSKIGVSITRKSDVLWQKGLDLILRINVKVVQQHDTITQSHHGGKNFHQYTLYY